jgi:hypothetical protein
MWRRGRFRIVGIDMSAAPSVNRTRPAFLVVVLGLLSLFAWAGIAIAAERCEVGSQGCMPAATHALHGDVHHDVEACATQIIASPHAIAAPVPDAAPTIGAPPMIVALTVAAPAIVVPGPSRSEGVRGLPSPLAATGRLRL